MTQGSITQGKFITFEGIDGALYSFSISRKP